jgi:hypothetical protein
MQPLRLEYIESLKAIVERVDSEFVKIKGEKFFALNFLDPDYSDHWIHNGFVFNANLEDQISL